MADCLDSQALLPEARVEEPQTSTPVVPPDRCVRRSRASIIALVVASAVALLIGSTAVTYFPSQRHIPMAHERSALEAGVDSLGQVSALIFTYNHGEACGDLDGRDVVVEELRAQISENDPDIVTMMSQEVRKFGRKKPLQEAVSGLDYTWIGSSDLAGYTKLFCHQVDTAVQVAVSKKLLADLETASAEHCSSSDVCNSEDSDKTGYRYYHLKRTKGHVAVHASIKSLGFVIRFAGVHLDTGDFDDNLKSYAAPAFGELEKDSPGVTIVAGDFNSRMVESGYSQMCQDGAITGDRLVEAMDVDRSEVLDVLRLSEVGQLLQDGVREAASDDGLRAELVPPAVGKAEGKSFILPTYKFPSYAQVKSEDMAGQTIKLFGEHGSEVCDKQKFGVLDSVAAIYNPDKITVDLPPRATWKKISGSDHALISARILLSGATS